MICKRKFGRSTYLKSLLTWCKFAVRRLAASKDDSVPNNTPRARTFSELLLQKRQHARQAKIFENLTSNFENNLDEGTFAGTTKEESPVSSSQSVLDLLMRDVSIESVMFTE